MFDTHAIARENCTASACEAGKCAFSDGGRHGGDLIECGPALTKKDFRS